VDFQHAAEIRQTQECPPPCEKKGKKNPGGKNATIVGMTSEQIFAGGGAYKRTKNSKWSAYYNIRRQGKPRGKKPSGECLLCRTEGCRN